MRGRFSDWSAGSGWRSKFHSALAACRVGQITRENDCLLHKTQSYTRLLPDLAESRIKIGRSLFVASIQRTIAHHFVSKLQIHIHTKSATTLTMIRAPSNLQRENWETFHKRHGSQSQRSTGTSSLSFCGCMEGEGDCSWYSRLMGVFQPAPQVRPQPNVRNGSQRGKKKHGSSLRGSN